MTEYEKASDFRPLPGEANFGPPIDVEVRQGLHIAPEIIPARGRTLFATRWPNGLPRHDDPPNTVRFAHGLMLFGETIEECARRLVNAQMGLNVEGVTLLDIDSYVDDNEHWHLEPTVLAEVTGSPKTPSGASEIISFTADAIPELTYWPHDDLRSALEGHIDLAAK